IRRCMPPWGSCCSAAGSARKVCAGCTALCASIRRTRRHARHWWGTIAKRPRRSRRSTTSPPALILDPQFAQVIGGDRSAGERDRGSGRLRFQFHGLGKSRTSGASVSLLQSEQTFQNPKVALLSAERRFTYLQCSLFIDGLLEAVSRERLRQWRGAGQ